MRRLIPMLPLVVLALSLGAGRSLAGGVAVGVEVGGGAAAPGGADVTEAQLKQAAAAAGEADLVAVVKVTEVSEPKKDEAGDKKEDGNPRPNVLGLGVVRGGMRGGATDKLFTAEVTELLKGDKEAKVVKIKANIFKGGQAEHVMMTIDREFKDANGGVVRKFTQQMSVPLTLAKDKKSLVFLKVAEEKKDDAGKVTERTYKLIQPLFDGAPEKALAAVRDALKRIEEWKDPPKLSAEEQAAVEKLIKQLGSDDYATREAATKELIAKGARIKALMEAATKNPDAEINQRAAQVIEAIKPESLKPQDPSTGFGSGGGVMMMQNGVQMQMQVQMGAGQ